MGGCNVKKRVKVRWPKMRSEVGKSQKMLASRTHPCERRDHIGLQTSLLLSTISKCQCLQAN